MTGQELITHLRESILDDATLPYLWLDAELLRYLNYAQVQACRRSALLYDSNMENLTVITLSTSPDIDAKYHENLMDWAAHLAYMKTDSETLNLNLAKIYEQKFETSFGPLISARGEELRNTMLNGQRMRARPFGS